jgi:hypothetical protein
LSDVPLDAPRAPTGSWRSFVKPANLSPTRFLAQAPFIQTGGNEKSRTPTGPELGARSGSTLVPEGDRMSHVRHLSPQLGPICVAAQTPFWQGKRVWRARRR